MPATISPITRGWPIRAKSQPVSRAASTMTTTCMSRTASGWWRFPSKTPSGELALGAPAAAAATCGGASPVAVTPPRDPISSRV